MTGDRRVNEFSSDIYDQIPGKLQFLLVSAAGFVCVLCLSAKVSMLM